MVGGNRAGRKSRARTQRLVSRIPSAREIYFTPLHHDAIQEALEKAFFASIRLRNGTYKYTHAGRLDDVNKALLPLLPPIRPLEVMDVAVSSGISTLEWQQQLEQEGIRHRMVAGDLLVNAFLVSRGQRLHALVDASGYPLQYEIYGRVVPVPTGVRLRALYFAPLRLLRRILVSQFSRLSGECIRSTVRWAEGKRGVVCRHVALVSPRLQRSACLEVIEDDILADEWSGRRCHVLRAANILNRAYFDEPTLRRALHCLGSRLLPGGFLVVCRTYDSGVNGGTVFRLEADQTLAIVARIGGGSEVENLVIGL